MISYGSLMSQALQCTQLAALICRRLPACAVVDHLVDTRRAEALAGIAEFLGAAVDADAGIGHLQVHRLALIVRVAGKEHGRQAVARRQRALHPVPVAAR